MNKLEKYIYRYTNIRINVKIQKYIRGGFGARLHFKYLKNGRIIEFTLLKIREDSIDNKPLIWHEIGHMLYAKTHKNSILTETKAQLCALEKLKILGYNKLYKESIEYVDKYWLDSENKKQAIYNKARKSILNKIKHMPSVLKT